MSRDELGCDVTYTSGCLFCLKDAKREVVGSDK
jgi:hypothetical protein